MSDHLEPNFTSTLKASPRGLPAALLLSMRPRQWTKNGLLLLALVFSQSLLQWDLVARSLLGLVAFTLLASAIYLVNDILDVERDRQHPIKRHRPIASGRVSPTLAIATSALLLTLSLLLAFTLGRAFTLISLLYVAITLAYSFQLKKLVILDVLAVSAGFVLRAAAGAVVIGVPISPWLYVCTVLGALFLVFSKRRHELTLLQATAANHRQILGQYTVSLLDQMISVVTSALIIAYSLYTFSAENLPRDNSMMLTIPFLLYGVFRYLYLVQSREAGGSPEEVLLTDRPLQATVLGWGALSVLLIYTIH